MNAVGMNTADSTSAMPTTGPETSSIALKVGVLRRHAFLDVVLDRLHDDDRVVHHEADRQHQAEQRQRVDGKAEQREEDERPDERDRHGQQRNQRRAPALQEDEDDDDDQHDGDQRASRRSP